jgi:hypothetical protein
MRGDDVLAAVRTCRDALEPALDRDWSVAVPDLEFTVASVLAHAATSTTWYALDVWSGPGDDAAFETNAGDRARLPPVRAGRSGRVRRDGL